MSKESSSTSLAASNFGVETPQSPYATPQSSVSSADFYQQDEIAVIGMACRLPGGINSPLDLWQAMMERKDTSGEMPKMRWEPYYARDPRNAKVLDNTTSKGCFLEHCEDFDAAFFGVSPKEAEQMDPQQRITLEVAWEALENAGIPPKSLSGSDTAVFMGVNSDDYAKLLLEDLPGVEAHMGIGTAYCGVPNRISYVLNLMGASTAVDAACASSLVAIHHGRQAILNRESKIAIVGGVNVLCGPGLTSVLDKAGAISSDGSCMSFDNDAKGYVRGEGAAVIILKRFSEAIRDNDNVIALLKGSAVAQDGRTNGIMAPNAKAQELVAKQALKSGNIESSSIQYVEAHATSTPLGDPTEVSAIASVYGSNRRSPDDPVLIGSVKPNVGHLEAGAGVTGFVKTLLAMQAGVLPPQANLKTLNSKIDWDRARVKVVRNATKWPHTEEPRRAAVASYGYGGTVSHAVIEEAPPKEQQEAPTGQKEPEILVLSAPRQERLAKQAADISAWLTGEGSKSNVRKVASTLACRREQHDYRLSIVAEDIEEAAASLEDFANGKNGPFSFSSRQNSSKSAGKVVWVFSGHGAQWPAMGKELLEDPIFVAAIMPLDPHVQHEIGFSAIQSLRDQDFTTTDKIQVLCYVMQIGLSAVLHSKGLAPTAVVGHSVGELAASVEAGCLSAIEGVLIVCRRAKLYKQVIGAGGMAMVQLPFEEVQQSLKDRRDVAAAIDSSPSSCVVSGETSALETYLTELQSREIKPLRVKTDVPFHSPVLDHLVEALVTELKDALNPQEALIPLYSTSDPDPRSKILRDASYWTRNMVKPVYLTSAVQAAVEDGMVQFLEVSTHPIVSHSINETIMNAGIEEYSVEPTVLRSKPVMPSILNAIGKLWCQGVKVNWQKAVGIDWEPAVPGTKWMHKPYWRDVKTGVTAAGSTHDPEKHTLLGQRHAVALSDDVMFTSKLDEANKPFPGNHPLHGVEIIPAAGLINTFHSATAAPVLSNIILRVPVAISAPREIQVLVQGNDVKICSRLDQGDNDDGSKSWVTHTTGSWNLERPKRPARLDIEAIKARIGTQLASDFSISYLDKVGVSAMGFPWTVTEHFGNLQEMIAKVDVAPDVPADGKLPWDENSWAPILDAATSVGSTLFFDDPQLRMPAAISEVQFFDNAKPPRFASLHVQRDAETEFSVHVSVLDQEGQALAAFKSMRFSEIEGTPGANSSVESLVHRVAWPPAAFAEKPLALKSVILVSEDAQTGAKYKDELIAHGSVVTTTTHACEVPQLEALQDAKKGQSAILFVPAPTSSAEDIPAAAEKYIAELLTIVKCVVNQELAHRIFVLTNRVTLAATNDALAQAPLHGLARIIASEHPDQWGALIDLETKALPIAVMKYVRDTDVVRMSDGIPRVARLRPMQRERLYDPNSLKLMSPRPEGTYVISGGLGALGLEVADYLVEKGARRLVLLSRRDLPMRKDWPNEQDPAKVAILDKILALEKHGAVISVLSTNLGADPNAADLAESLEQLSLPPVLGIVHAAGVLEDQLVLDATTDSFARVLKPKVSGALALHRLFPPGELDFFVFFSSCGQLFGFPGQGSYASGNAFLDTLAAHRRALGDNAVSFQWTSWHGMGMAASTDFISAELASKGITDVSRDDAFRAWEYVSRFDMDHAVVLRSLPLPQGEPLPAEILADIVVRQAAPEAGESCHEGDKSGAEMPASGPEQKAYLEQAISACIAEVLMSGVEEVDPRVALSDLGIDSVMTVNLRRLLQTRLKVKMPPTLTWSHPTVSHLVGWFAEKLA